MEKTEPQWEMPNYRTRHSINCGWGVTLYVEEQFGRYYHLGMVDEEEGETTEVCSMMAVSLEQLRMVAENLTAVVARLEREARR